MGQSLRMGRPGVAKLIRWRAKKDQNIKELYLTLLSKSTGLSMILLTVIKSFSSGVLTLRYTMKRFEICLVMIQSRN
jgi:hypothetical protein